MTNPLRKHTIEERATYNKDQARLDREASLVGQHWKQLKREGISRLAKSNRKRKYTNNDDNLSVLSAIKCSKELKGHNKFETANIGVHQLGKENGRSLRLFMFPRITLVLLRRLLIHL